MRSLLMLVTVSLVGLAVLPARAQETGVDYSVEVDPHTVLSRIVEKEGKTARMVSLRFQIKRLSDKATVTSIPKEEIFVEEDGKKVLSLEIFQPKAQQLTVVLAMDISGSMARGEKLKAAKDAALSFLSRMDDRADVGLILFDHQIRQAVPPVRDPSRQKAHRDKLREIIRSAKPQGGTAYLDATVEGVKMLKGIPGEGIVVVMTDGVDMNSQTTLDKAIETARTAEVRVYTIGIGAPGKNEQVTTVLVLDRSGSMDGKANDTDALKKIEALKRAAQRFVALIRPGSQTTIQSFSTGLDPVEPFTENRADLRKRINALVPNGGTLLYDATFAGIETLEASGVKGRRAVVVLTDGVDERPGSRRSDEAVIERAREVKIPLYMLGLGRPGDINESVMQKMAKDTGGEYYHAGNEHRLLEVFENLSIQLHDDGIDERSLTKLAKETGGRYTHVSNMSELRFIYEQLADELQKTYEVRFQSRRAQHDGTARGIDVTVVRGGKVVSTGGRADDVARGVAVPQMSYGVYLAFLACLGLLLLVPGVLRKLARPAGGA